MRILIFEDPQAEQLSPIALTRPVCDLVCGRESLRDRLHRWYPGGQHGVWLRPWLKDVVQEQSPETRVNDADWLRQGPVVLINGRWLPGCRLDPDEVRADTAGYIDGNLVWIALDSEEAGLLSTVGFHASLLQLAAMRRIVDASGRMFRHPWDLVAQNGEQLACDFADEGLSQMPQAEQVVVLGDPGDVYVSALALLDPFVVLDCRNGPISIDRDVHVQPFTRIEGPCHIGRGSRLFRAHVRSGTTIGPHCRVGGEIEASIFHACVNKYHEGFIGHSYVCPWVNLGAMTCTSDLKIDYSDVRVPVSEDSVDSGQMKVGSFIGDHARTALDSMFNTGSSIGVMSTVLPGGRLLPKHIPSFCGVHFGELSAERSIEAAFSVARVAMQRRGEVLTKNAEALLRIVYEQTERERQTALSRAIRKRMQA